MNDFITKLKDGWANKDKTQRTVTVVVGIAAFVITIALFG